MPKHNSTNPKPLPAAEYLRACLDYVPETGELRWKQRPREHFITERAWLRSNTVYAGTIAGVTVNRYQYTIGISNAVYQTHRVIWKMITSNEPPASLDHKDGNGFNNRWANLRAATPLEQQRNRKRPYNSTNPYRGVYRSSKGSWAARIGVNRKLQNLGSFATPEEAAAAYETAARRIHGEFYRDVSTSK